MAVPPIDLKEIWNSGQSYSDWLAAVKNPKMREEMERTFGEVSVPDAVADTLNALKRPVYVLALIEDWCGDVRRNAPVLAKLNALNPEHVRVRCVDKESRPQLMVRYLTNAAEAIPIFVFFNAEFVEVGHWGPRPAQCKLWMARGKAAGKVDEARAKIKEFYGADKHQSTVAEIAALIGIASTSEL